MFEQLNVTDAVWLELILVSKRSIWDAEKKLNKLME